MQGISADELQRRILQTAPKTQATRPDFVKFHDDKRCSTSSHCDQPSCNPARVAGCVLRDP